MDYTKPISLGIAEKLKADEGYRNAFFRSYATDSIALQIRTLRKLRDKMKQAELAEACGMKQSAISRVEQAEYSSWTFNTLWRVAEALKSRLIITFQPMEEAISDYEVREAASFSMKDGSRNVNAHPSVGGRINAGAISHESTPPPNLENTEMTMRVGVSNHGTEVHAHV